jgi:DHA2 family multidrug resistance protein
LSGPAKEDSGQQQGGGMWLAVAAGTLGALMATLDISIVNAALPRLQGEIGASGEEGTWVSTAYLVAEIIMIPLAGWLVRIFGLRRFLLTMTIGFICFSMLCGISTSLIEMIIGRVGQGFTGGAMIPTALTIVATRVPPEKRAIGISLFGMTVIMGPVLGPVIGGWLTENYTWHYAFFMNVPIGIALTGLLIFGLPPEKPHLGLLAKADWLGVLALVIALSSLTVVLEEGERQLWLQSVVIFRLTLLSIFGFLLLIFTQYAAPFYNREPVIDLKILFEPSFGSVFLMGLVVGGGLYGVLYLIPQYLTDLAGYNPATSGYVAAISGIPSLLCMICFPLLVRYIDLRVAVGTGFVLYAASCFVDSGAGPGTAGPEFFWPQILRGFGQTFCMMFLNQAATVAVTKDKADDASGLFNAARNLGGSISLAIISTLQERRNWLHTHRIEESFRANSPAVQAYVQSLALKFGNGDPVLGHTRALAQIQQQIHTQSSIMSYNDIYHVFGIFMILVLPLVFLLKPLPANFSGGKGH